MIAAALTVSFIDEHRAQLGGEPICEQLPIAPSGYYHVKARQEDPALRPKHRQPFVFPGAQQSKARNLGVRFL
ncbi:MAG TPA: hypothetical protein VMU33_08215 [Burkholderiaceae bacterium]|nr:hypothetical protein [Burkholderiaceae bacterium]